MSNKQNLIFRELTTETPFMGHLADIDCYIEYFCNIIYQAFPVLSTQHSGVYISPTLYLSRFNVLITFSKYKSKSLSLLFKLLFSFLTVFPLRSPELSWLWYKHFFFTLNLISFRNRVSTCKVLYQKTIFIKSVLNTRV